MPVDADLRFNSGVVFLTIATRLLTEHYPMPSMVLHLSLTCLKKTLKGQCDTGD